MRAAPRAGEKPSAAALFLKRYALKRHALKPIRLKRYALKRYALKLEYVVDFAAEPGQNAAAV